MRYLITGHTGFKGAWLSMLLQRRGHEVHGLALDPVEGGLYQRARVAELMAADHRVDIRDAAATAEAIGQSAPDVVLHLAAQPLVRESYAHPRETIDINVTGTMNVLDAVASAPGVRSLVVVTTDKVYRNVEQEAGYTEDAPLGGHDPYSASKAMADLLTQSWVASFPGVPTAIARAGNVIGGGDVSADRLVPDLFTAFRDHRAVSLRYPRSVRPWQHVLDCLEGYLELADALLRGRGAGAWNFGPGRESFVPVADVADAAAAFWGSDRAWEQTPGEHPHEAGLLALDAEKAQRELGWRNRLPYPSSLEWTVDWQRAVDGGEDPRAATWRQIDTFERLG